MFVPKPFHQCQLIFEFDNLCPLNEHYTKIESKTNDNVEKSSKKPSKTKKNIKKSRIVKKKSSAKKVKTEKKTRAPSKRRIELLRHRVV